MILKLKRQKGTGPSRRLLKAQRTIYIYLLKQEIALLHKGKGLAV